MLNNNVVKTMLDITIEKVIQNIANTDQDNIDRIEAEKRLEELKELRESQEALLSITEYLMNYPIDEDAISESNLRNLDRRHPGVLDASNKFFDRQREN